MELRDIETFLVLSEELHFGRAAARLHISQGRVSQVIRALEQEIGGALFERTSRCVRLTSLGERFRAGAAPAHDRLATTLRECRSMAREVSGTLRIDYLPSVGLDFVDRLGKAFHAAYPASEAVFRTCSFRFFVLPEGPLAAQDVDLLLVWCPGGSGDALRSPGVTVGPVLAEEPRGLLVPADHPLADQSTVSLEDLVGHRLIDPGPSANPQLRDLWVPPVSPLGHPIERTPDDIAAMTGTDKVVIDDILTLVLAGRGLWCTILSLLDRFPCAGLAMVPIRDLPPMVVVPAWLTAHENATIRAFVATATAVTTRGNNTD